MALTKAGAMVKNLRVKKKTPAWIVAARNTGSTTLQDPLRFTLLRGGGGGGKGLGRLGVKAKKSGVAV